MTFEIQKLYLDEIRFDREDGGGEVEYQGVESPFFRDVTLTALDLCRFMAVRMPISPSARMALLLLLECKTLGGCECLNYTELGKGMGVSPHSAKRAVAELRSEGILATIRVGKESPTVKFTMESFIRWAEGLLYKAGTASAASAAAAGQSHVTPAPAIESPAPSSDAYLHGATTTTSTNTVNTASATVITTVTTTVVPNLGFRFTPGDGDYTRRSSDDAIPAEPEPAPDPVPGHPVVCEEPTSPAQAHVRRASKRKSALQLEREECGLVVRKAPKPTAPAAPACTAEDSQPIDATPTGDQDADMDKLREMCARILELCGKVSNPNAAKAIKERMELGVEWASEGDMRNGLAQVEDALDSISMATGPKAAYPGAYVRDDCVVRWDPSCGYEQPDWDKMYFPEHDVDPSDEIEDSREDIPSDEDEDEFNFTSGCVGDGSIMENLRFNPDV